MYLVGAICGLAAFILLVIYVPVCAYFVFRLSQRRREGCPLSWHDAWGWNRASLLFFPALLDDQGKQYQRRAMGAAKAVLLGAMLAIASFYLTGELAI